MKLVGKNINNLVQTRCWGFVLLYPRRVQSLTFLFYIIILTFQNFHTDFELLNRAIPQIVQEGQLIYSLGLIEYMNMYLASIAIELIFKVVVYQIPSTVFGRGGGS